MVVVVEVLLRKLLQGDGLEDLVGQSLELLSGLCPRVLTSCLRCSVRRLRRLLVTPPTDPGVSVVVTTSATASLASRAPEIPTDDTSPTSPPPTIGGGVVVANASSSSSSSYAVF